MNRRHVLACIGSLACAPLAFAHHGWSSFDQSRPLFLRGTVRKVDWANPHVEIDLEVEAKLALPADLAGRTLPAQSAQVDGRALLARAALPDRGDRVWRIEFAPLSRMEAWRIERLRAGEQIELLGFTFPPGKGQAILRAEYLFRDGKVYGLRSSPV